MSEQLPLLIELGTEELPVKALPGLAQAFFDGVLAGLEKRGVAVTRGDAKPLSTPRRLAVLLPGVATEQPEQRSEVLGPYLNIALDAEGKPTKALAGFAAKAGIDWTALERTSDAKGERFVHRAVTPGAQTAALLPEILREAIAAMPIPKPMRWGAHEYAFARPVQWLVLLFGNAVIPAELLGVRGDRITRGHRFMHDGDIALAAPGDYIDALRAAHVLVDADARRARIVEEVDAAARQAGGSARISDDNLEQVVNLVEWPSAVLCSFERAFLAVPQEALIETMEINQKFFPVLDDGGKLTEQFIGIANIVSRDVAEVAKGYERVIRPRFADAKFFFDEDLKQGLEAMGAGLASVTYQAKLGTVADKVARVAALAEAIAPQVGADPVQARRAAELAKNDLQSRMVNEFPELQGIAGRHYAKAAGEPSEISLAIDEAYQPRFAGDDIALSPLGKVLAIAERLDTLAGGFAAGLKPTGNKDPFALRRNALGLARTVIESGFELDLRQLLFAAANWVYARIRQNEVKDRADLLLPLAKAGGSVGDFNQAFKGTFSQLLKENPDAAKQEVIKGLQLITQEIFDFILDRLRGYYADKGVPATHFNAVAALFSVAPEGAPTALGVGAHLGATHGSLYDFDRRIDAIGIFATLPEAEALAAANKRIRNILRKVEGEIPGDIDTTLLREPAEEALAEAVEAAIGDTGDALHRHDYVAVLARLARLRPQVDAFFDGVMVNADDPQLRANRLALLKKLGDRLGSVAAIEHLSS
ncbi:glycine--tRNA ligase subunit beta [Xanthomonas campestris]|uniref:glycine--tRNA ligase subunit beta n=1 Tax=Xanthomonas campestris TaxID=339 RepID=UPI002B228AA1|nr:glycine--tRNA ligase subunit beta [Xanthomonas campestris]MEA9660082.1 glycine--tRNA ligase subunit beta [Xanthomonas campestris pv. raphani]MEA9765310.1 glycine--tRNA ligase subunit beta [Xanthomonas campestris pv. raphani]MEA9817554.1 glycine--tRNA ligase subunit beta [Xanthomonas campestris pv. raphani]MEA9910405.1 glycine--tRNA ligase subunit beta [Xanthomonas campestris pv. raphani]MEA9927118.1 glycine--tRNA ligase subunit beta [Xanthomonas campestris pv. raphani]